MNSLVYISAVLGTIVVIISIVYSIKRNKIEGYEFVVKETKTMLLLTALSLGIGYFFLYYKLINPDMGGEGKEGYWLVAILGFLVLAMAGYTIVYCFCNRIYVYEDKMIVLKPFEKTHTVLWDDIQVVEQPKLSKAAKFTCTDVTFQVSGANKKYKQFMSWIRDRIKGKTRSRLLGSIEKNLTK